MSKPVSLLTLKTPDGVMAKYFSMQEHSDEEWIGIVARYETETFPANTIFVNAVVIARLSNDETANKFIAGQVAVFEEARILCLNSYRPVKSRPKLELVEA